MTRVQNLVHHDEFPDVRKDFEASHPAATAKPVRRPYPGCSADALKVLHAADTSWAKTAMRRPVAPPPVVLIDWSARIAADWQHVDARLDNATAANARNAEHTGGAYAHGAQMLVAPLLSELTELRMVQLVNWRQALRVHAEAELALIDDELAKAGA